MKLIILALLTLITAIQAKPQTKPMSLVAQDNCGTQGKEPHLVSGESYLFPKSSNKKSSQAIRSCTFGDKVIYAYDGMDIQADYSLKLTFLSDRGDKPRKFKVLSDTRELAVISLPPGKLIQKEIDLPKFAYAYGKLQLIFEKLEGANAVVSEIKIFSSNPKKLKIEKNTAKTQTFDYDKVPIPQPTYTPFPESTAGVATPVMSLNGKWQFNPTPSPSFPLKKGAGWKPIDVPAHWTMQGFIVKDGTYAGYTREFTLPANWANQHIRLRFDSVFSDCIVYLNGKEVGRHLGTFTAFEFNVSKFVRAGKNTVSLQVRNDSMADNLGSLNQYANFPLGGILRKVTLFALPQVHITDLRITTDFDKAFKNAELGLQFEIENTSGSDYSPSVIKIKIPDAVKTHPIKIPQIKSGKRVTVTATIPVPSPKKWDNEHPNLYTLEASLENKGKSIEQISKRFGFRKVEIQGNRMLVNGKPIKLAGVCRHEAHPLLGRSLTMDQWRKDAELYMTGNVNFIRTSHYPPAEEFIEICDELGLFVELEAPIGWVGHGANYSWKKLNYKDSQWYPYMLQANMETTRFLRNHPSIIMWSLANESYWSENFVNVLKHMEKEDLTRPYVFHDQDYGGFNNKGSNAPVANIHYPGPGGAQKVKDYTRPITFGEFCHLNVYNREELVTDPGIRNTWGLCLDQIWEQMVKTDACLGGSIWSGIDDLFLLPDGRAVGYGAWGPIDGWRRPKPEYFYLKKVYSPIRVTTTTLAPGTSATLDISNRHIFTNVNELKITWKCGTKSGTATADIAPNTSGKLTINTPLKEGDDLSVSFFSPKGYLIDQFDLPVGKIQSSPSEHQLPESPIKLVKSSKSLTLTGKNFVCTVDATTGMITSFKKNGKPVITSGPTLVLNPLKGGGCFPNHTADTPAWDPLCSNWKPSDVKVNTTPNAVTITASGRYTEAKGSFTTTIHGNARIEISYDFTTLAKIDPRQVGLELNLSNRFSTLTWERQSSFSGFSTEHIGRLKGSSPAFYGEKPNYKVDSDGKVIRKFIRKQPTHPWSHDANELGSADFRGTRTGILFYKMSAKNGDTLTLLSDGTQAGRCRIHGDHVRLYCLDINTGGSELFLGSHLNRFRHPLKKGAKVTGKMTIHLQ